jgi:hypothetical protein
MPRKPRSSRLTTWTRSSASSRPRQGEQLLLVAAARPAAIQPQQVAVDGGQRQALGGVSMPLGVIEHLLVAPPAGALHPGPEPVQQHRLPGGGHLPKQLDKLVQGRHEAAVGLAEAEVGQGPNSRSRLSPTSILEMPTARAARR